MRRYYAGWALALFECALLAWSPNALSASDLFATRQYVASGPFASTSEICPKDRIQQPLTLADVVDLALCNNPQTHSLWASSRVQAAQLGSSISSYLPTLTGPISVSRSRTTTDGTSTASNQGSVGLTISYLLYDFGGRAAGVENARQLLVAANSSRDATLQNIYLNAVQSYYSLLSTRASVQAYQSAETAAAKSLDAAQARYQAGAATPADKLQAQTALSQATLNRIRAEGDAANAQGTLANVMGFEATQPFELAPVTETIPDMVAEENIGKLIDEARQNRPDLVAAEAQIKAAEAQIVAARAAGLPTVSLNGSASRFNSNGTTASSYSKGLGISLSVPLFTGFRDTYQLRTAQAQLEGRQADREQVMNQIALDVWKAYQSLRTNSQSLRAADDLLASAELSEKMASGRYRAGLGSILDVLNAQSALASASQQRVAALYNYQASKFALVQAIGQLDLSKVGISN